MSSPLPDISATSPGDALGDSAQAPLPQIGVGSRGKRGKPSGGLLNRIGGMRAPGAPSRSQSEARANLNLVRKEPDSKPTPPPFQPADDRQRTAAGAPADRPRQVPKTGRTERYRDAMNTILGKDSQRWYHGQQADVQDVYNKVMRAHGTGERRGASNASKGYLQDRLNELRGVKNAPAEDEETARNRAAINIKPEDKSQ